MTDVPPFLSVITVCYNAGKTISRTLQSLRDQQNQNFELIIVDGASTDNTLDVVKSFGNLASRIISEKDGGIYDAMNKGLKFAKGRFVSFLNADDSYFTHTIQQLVLASADVESDIYYGNLEKQRSFNGKVHKRIEKPDLQLMPRTMGVFHPATFVKRDLFKTHGGFNTAYRLAADYDWFLKVYLAGCKFHYIDQPLARFTIGGASNFSCESYREAAIIQQIRQTGFHEEMQQLHTKCISKMKKQRVIAKFVNLWPLRLAYEAYLQNKWR